MDIKLTNQLLNLGKDLIIRALCNEGILHGDPEKIASEYVVVGYQKNWFGKIWDFIRNVSGDSATTTFAVMKNVDTTIYPYVTVSSLALQTNRRAAVAATHAKKSKEDADDDDEVGAFD